MKIIHICHLYDPSIGGNQLQSKLLSEELVKLNCEVHVLTTNSRRPYFDKPEPEGLLPAYELINGVHVHRFKVHYRLNNLLFNKIYKMRGGCKFLQKLFGKFDLDFWEHGPLVLPDMLLAARRLKPDLVMASNNYPFTALIGSLAKKYFSLPFVFMPITHVADPWTFHAALRNVLVYSDLILACTQFEKDFLQSQGIFPEKVKVVPLGFNPDEFKNADESRIREKYNLGSFPVVGYIGRQTRWKGIDTLIDAMPYVWRRVPEARLMLAGLPSESFAPVLQEHLERLTPEEREKIIITGHFDGAEKKDYYAALDIFAMPSNVDSFGMVYLEAWCSGRPVIACRKTPQETLVHPDEDGLLVEYENPVELSGAILKLMTDPALRRSMGDAGRQRVHYELSLENYGRNVLQAYENLLSRLKKKAHL